MPKKKPKGAVARLKASEDAMWAQIRERFEIKGDGARALGREFGVAHTTILRRSAQEGWQRNEGAIAAHLATQGVLDHLEKAETDCASDGANAVSQHHSQNGEHAEKIVQIAKPAPAESPGALAADQQDIVLSAKKIGRQQQKQLLQEIEIADAMIAGSTVLAKRLRDALETHDPNKLAELLAPFRTAGKMESFSSLWKAAIAGLKEGVGMRRRALGFSPNAGYGQTTNSTPISDGDLPAQVQSMLPNMPIEELMKLRDAAAMLNKRIEIAPPPAAIIDGEFDDYRD